MDLYPFQSDVQQLIANDTEKKFKSASDPDLMIWFQRIITKQQNWLALRLII